MTRDAFDAVVWPWEIAAMFGIPGAVALVYAVSAVVVLAAGEAPSVEELREHPGNIYVLPVWLALLPAWAIICLPPWATR